MGGRGGALPVTAPDGVRAENRNKPRSASLDPREKRLESLESLPQPPAPPRAVRPAATHGSRHGGGQHAGVRRGAGGPPWPGAAGPARCASSACPCTARPGPRAPPSWSPAAAARPPPASPTGLSPTPFACPVRACCVTRAPAVTRRAGPCARIVLSQYLDGALSEEAGSLSTQDAPLRMALSPAGTCLVLAMGKGGLERFDVDLSAKPLPGLAAAPGPATCMTRVLVLEVLRLAHTRRAKLDMVELPTAAARDWGAGEVRQALQSMGMVKALAFSRDGRRLALGGEDGSITVLDWPSARISAALRCARPERQLGGRA